MVYHTLTVTLHIGLFGYTLIEKLICHMLVDLPFTIAITSSITIVLLYLYVLYLLTIILCIC